VGMEEEGPGVAVATPHGVLEFFFNLINILN
jgi:hypothetical protein